MQWAFGMRRDFGGSGDGQRNAGIVCFACGCSTIHEAAIGKIAGEQILKLKTLGLTDEQAEEKIIQGFLK